MLIVSYAYVQYAYMEFILYSDGCKINTNCSTFITAFAVLIITEFAGSSAWGVVSVRNPPGVFLSSNSRHVHIPGEVPPSTLCV